MKKTILLLLVLVSLGVNISNAEDMNAKLERLQHKLSENPNDPRVLVNIGCILYEAGKYEEAETFLKKGLIIKKELPHVSSYSDDKIFYLKGLVKLIKIYEKLNKDDEAISWYKVMQAEPMMLLRRLDNRPKKIIREEAREIYDLVTNKSHICEDLNNDANSYQEQGEYAIAEDYYRRCLDMREDILGKDHILVADILNNLSNLYFRQGKYKEAEKLYQRALSIYLEKESKISDTSAIATVLDNLAKLYYEQDKYERSEIFYQFSLTFKKEDSDITTSLNTQASLYLAQGNYDKAASLLEQILKIRENKLGKNHLDVAQSLNNLAVVYRAKNEYEKAELLYQQSIKIKESILGKTHPEVVHSLNNLAGLYFAGGKYEQAIPLLKRSLRIMNQLLERWLWGASEKTRQSYIKIQENNRNFYYLNFYSLCNLPEEAFYFSLSRKGLLLKISSELSGLTKQTLDPAIKKQAQEFTALRSRLANLTFSNKADKTKIEELEEKINMLEMQISQKVSGFKRSKTEITPEQVFEKLNPENVVVDFLVFKEFDLKSTKPKTDQIIALTADKQNGIKLIKLGELAPIAEAIKTYRTAIVPTETNQNSREQTLIKTAKVLYQQLWQPLTPYLENKKTVYLIPDGILHLLPFKALQDPNGKYLAENYQLIILSSARDIVLPPLEGKASKSAIFAAPDYGNAPAASNTVEANELQTIHFSPLPNALNEGQQIDKLFKKTKVESLPPFLKAQATEQAINALTAPKILHLSTHGFFLEDIKPIETQNFAALTSFTNTNLPVGKIENPLTRSGLAFANANLGVKGIKQNDGSDGILTALEVLNLNLEGTDLVTLSACDTGVGDIKVGEGVYSLNRAFQEAGAKAVLSTLWEVDDQASSEFMQKFYTRFLDGKPAQTAIQETQQEFMQDKKYNNPYYWAGFVMTGKE